MAEYAVVGGGIAGRCVASLVQADLYDNGGPKASDVFAALCHPFPGRSFQMRPEQVDAWRTTLRWTSDHPRHVRAVEIRRAPDERLTKSLGHGPDLGQRIVQGRPTYQGLVMDMGAWVEALPLHAARIADDVSVVPDGHGVRVVGSTGTRIYERVVVCPGARLGAYLLDADVREFHGDILETLGSLDIAEFGAAHIYPTLRGTTAVGHTFSVTPTPAADVVEELRARAAKDGHELQATLRVWSGVRAVIHPDRWPVLTQIHPRVAVLGGLGAKGALFAPLLAEHAARWLGSNEGLPDAFKYPRVPTGSAVATPARSR